MKKKRFKKIVNYDESWVVPVGTMSLMIMSIWMGYLGDIVVALGTSIVTFGAILLIGYVTIRDRKVHWEEIK